MISSRSSQFSAVERSIRGAVGFVLSSKAALIPGMILSTLAAPRFDSPAPAILFDDSLFLHLFMLFSQPQICW